MTCPVCGKPLGRNKNACSMACYSVLRSNVKTCKICGTSFPNSASNGTNTCSKKCSRENRRRMAGKGVFSDALKKAREKLPSHPLTGRFDTHMHAKEWVIQSPSGEVYKCRNLLNWIRENEIFFEGHSAKRVFDGVAKIKASALGKRKNKSYQWRGWRLLDWGEE